MYSKWKTLTGALLQPHMNKTPQDVPHGFPEVIAKLDAILAPLIATSVDGDQRYRNLHMILTRAARLAFLLFSQPSTFRFDFSAPEGTMVVFPALVQTVDDRGQVLSRPRVLMEKEVVCA
jgi:hypothetical protein